MPRAQCSSDPGSSPTTALLTDLGCATDDNGWVVADPTGRTSVTGVWAAGNAVNPRAQVITAAGEGSAAAIAINNDLVDEDVRHRRRRLPRRPPGLTRLDDHPQSLIMSTPHGARTHEPAVPAHRPSTSSP